MSGNRPRGLTLLEVIIAASLGLLLLGALFQVVIPSMKVTLGRSARAEIELSAALAIGKLVGDLESSAPAGLSLRETAPKAVAIHPIADVKPDGGVRWEPWLIVYVLDGDRLVRKRWPEEASETVPQTRPWRVTSERLGVIARARSRNARTVAIGVTDFQVGYAGLAGTQPLRLRIGLERQVRDPPEAFTLTRDLHLRQSSN